MPTDRQIKITTVAVKILLGCWRGGWHEGEHSFLPTLCAPRRSRQPNWCRHHNLLLMNYTIKQGDSEEVQARMCFPARTRVFSGSAQMEVRTGRKSCWFGSSRKRLMKLQCSPSSQFSVCLCLARCLYQKNSGKPVLIRQTLCSLVNSRLEAHVFIFSQHLFFDQNTLQYPSLPQNENV